VTKANGRYAPCQAWGRQTKDTRKNPRGGDSFANPWNCIAAPLVASCRAFGAHILRGAGWCAIAAIPINCSTPITGPAGKFQERIDAAVRALRENNPRFKALSPQRVQALAEFVSGNMLFVLLHEMAHVSILGLDGTALTQASRLVAKVDSAAIQDGFDLYLHGFFVTDDGKWTVVQQGMNGEKRQARRYHWHSEGLTSFVEAPHSAIDGPVQGEIVNLTDRRRAAPSRAAQVDLLATLGPDRIVHEFGRLGRTEAPAQPLLPHLVMPAHHDVRPSDVFARRLRGTLAAAAERGPQDFAALLLTPGVGARTVQSLAMVAEVVHGAPYRFGDPARFSLAHGGKDRHPYPCRSRSMTRPSAC
jgi:hypothetical protein